MKNTKPILVTGGAGFLGSHLCDRLLADGHRVVCVDNLQTGSRANVAHLTGHPGFELIERDVTEPLRLDVKAIYNLACPASPVHYQADPIRTTRTCVLGALSVLELADRTGAPVLQASTSEVYGDPLVHPQAESYWGHVNPTGVRACYDEGKRCAETLFFDYSRQRGVRVKVVRIFNTYGSRMNLDDGRVVSNLAVQALAGRPLTIYGDGSQTRSFCHVDDMVEGLVRMMASADEVTGPVNLGNPREFTVRQLAEQLVEMTGSASPLRFLPLPADDPRQRRPDISKARELLGWQPKIELREGLERTIDYFERAMRAAGRPTRAHRPSSAGVALAAP